MSEKCLTKFANLCIIYTDDTQASHPAPRHARRQTARSGRGSPRLPAGAHRSSLQWLPQVRPRRRPPSVGAQRQLSRGQNTAAQPARRTGSSSTQSSAALPPSQGGSRSHQRTQSTVVAHGSGRVQAGGARSMIATRRLQRSFADGFIAEEVADLWEPWMRQADQVLEDDALLTLIQQELTRRIKKSQTRGRPGTTAEVVLRMLLLKHMRDYSFEQLSREVRANLVYREFTRVGGGKTPDDKSMGRLARQLRPEVIRQIHDRVVAMAKEEKIVQGRRMRVDTTVVETNIHYPTDSSLLGDGVRVLTRVMKKIGRIAGDVGTKLRVLDIARAARAKGPQSQERLKRSYGKLLNSTSRVVGQAKRFGREIADGVKRASDVLEQVALEGLRRQLDEMAPRVRQVMKQTRARVFGGDTRSEGKLLSLFEPSTEVIRKGKAAKPNEFGKMVKLQEAENQIVIDYEVYDRRPNDADLLIPAIDAHQARLGRAPS